MTTLPYKYILFIATHFNHEIMKETKYYIQPSYLNITNLVKKSWFQFRF